MNKKVWLLICLLSVTAMMAACGKKESDQVEIEFFQTKSEAIPTFRKLIAKFQEEHPDIKVIESYPPDAETVLRTRVFKRQMPEVIGIGGSYLFSELIGAEQLKNFDDSDLAAKSQEGYVQILKDVGMTDQLYGLPFVANASGVLYNQDLFEKYQIAVPKTWDEFMAAAETFQSSEVDPFYFTIKDAWTTLGAMNPIVANTQGDDFFEKRRNKETTFVEGYQEAADKLSQLFPFIQKNGYGQGYGDGNLAFANGQSAMYLQGIWAIPEIKKANPDIKIGVFAMPVNNEPDNNRLVSGVDLMLAQSAEITDKQKAAAADELIEFLYQEENVALYLEEQDAIPAIKGMEIQNENLLPLAPYIQNNQVVDFADHLIPSGVAFDSQVQTYVINQDQRAFLETMDREWVKVMNRKE
ncbi:extracellular solute-binding protein [Vagococcus sp. BWB3-3]|uniref:Extracellular solute-binding protein n=1 Tax=Vagococcus allomyrinae TaxID=2794353 RepID=A0A940SVM6_9ENTE|nr:extracellular solute-binding protein [Vagococcus allomyrinae]MBP1040483.1 extracellular solute-binding protein [Vagococcus allomyrinae]